MFGWHGNPDGHRIVVSTHWAADVGAALCDDRRPRCLGGSRVRGWIRFEHNGPFDSTKIQGLLFPTTETGPWIWARDRKCKNFDTMIAVLRDSADGLAMLHAIDERHRVGGHGIVTWDDKQAVAYRAAVKKAYFALRGT